MSITRAATRLGTCLRPLLQTSLGCFRKYSTGPLLKRPLTQKFQQQIKTFAQSFERTNSSKIPHFLAAGIALTSSYWLFNALEDQPPKEASTATEIPEVPDENDLSKDFEAKLDARRFTMVDSNGKEYDFGSNFHGYGKGLVKGMNLNFKKIEREDGTKAIELSFRVNHVFHQRLRKTIKRLAKLNPEHQQALARGYHLQGIMIDRKATYTIGQKPYFEDTAFLVHVEGLGSLMLGKKNQYSFKDQVKVTLNEGATLESFHQFLSIFGLQDALKKSSSEDLERLKIGILFRTFYPKQAYSIECDESFFTLPIDHLKQKVIDTTPEMKDVFAQYTVERHELFPGYVRYGAAVDKDIYALGGRALTTALTSTCFDPLNLDQFLQTNKKTDDIAPSELPLEKVDMVINILKNGLLSREMRDKNGMDSRGGLDGDYTYKKGGAQSVYTLIIKNEDLENRKKISAIHYSQAASVRLYISLEALNQGSYQFLTDKYGKKSGKAYINRPNIFNLVGSDFEAMQQNKDTMGLSHEIMVPDRVLPQHFKAMSVRTEEVKQQIISRMRDRNLLQKDQEGIERYNGIPIDEFIHTEDHITPELLKRCHQ